MKKGLDLWWCMENISHNIDEQLDRERSIISYVSLVKTIDTVIALLLSQSVLMSVCKPVALFCRILSRLGIE